MSLELLHLPGLSLSQQHPHPELRFRQQVLLSTNPCLLFFQAMTHLDKIKLWGKQIRVMPSKHTSVQLPKDGQPDAGLTKDYTASNLHRFKKPCSKNYSNIYPPSSTLHLSNIPSSVEETDLKQAFVNAGLNVQGFKFFPKDRKMALVQLTTVDDAITALVKLHNYQLSETSHLRVSFSKSTI